MKKYSCGVCAYMHEDDSPPTVCPQCEAGFEKFYAASERGLFFLNEHKVGIAKNVDKQVVEGLKENFIGECTEVGMYLAMSRQADREGYPEVAEAFKRIAFEEAEHAAKFAELLGEVVNISTRKNLELRVDAEHEATQSKMIVANRAKELGLDAIHDVVLESAKDEARHCMAFNGLLQRYF